MITLITNLKQKIYTPPERLNKVKSMLSSDNIMVLEQYDTTEEELNDLFTRFKQEVKEAFIP